MKSVVASALARRVKEGDVIGLGSGSTVEIAIDQIGQRISREGLHCSGVATSHHTALIAKKAGIQVLSSVFCPELDWAFDGADEVDSKLSLIKGRHGAMLLEKIVAKRAREYYVIVSEDKIVSQLGERFAIPVEVIPESVYFVEAELLRLGAKAIKLRQAVHTCGPIMSEHNNFILDCSFDEIDKNLELKIKSVTGVVESGLFIGLNPNVLVARSNGLFLQRLVEGRLVEEAFKSF